MDHEWIMQGPCDLCGKQYGCLFGPNMEFTLTIHGGIWFVSMGTNFYYKISYKKIGIRRQSQQEKTDTFARFLKTLKSNPFPCECSYQIPLKQNVSY